MEKPIEIQKKRKPAFLFILILLGVGAGAEWLFFEILFPKLPGFFRFKVTAAVLVAALIVWAIVMVIKQTSRKFPGLIIKEDGLIDQSNLLSVGFIPWGDIIGFKMAANEFKSALIVVLVKNCQAYINKPMKYRESRVIQFKQFGSPVVIAAGILETNPAELFTLLQSRLAGSAADQKPPALPVMPGQVKP